MSRKHYGVEFKDEACKLVSVEGYKPSEAARKLGVGVGTLENWLRKRGWRAPLAGSAEGDDPAALRARVKDLEARLRKSEMANEILKKATAYFAREHL
jgi:transposase